MTVCGLPVFAGDGYTRPTEFDYNLLNSDTTLTRTETIDNVTYNYINKFTSLIDSGHETVSRFFNGSGYYVSYDLINNCTAISGGSFGFLIRVVFDSNSNVVYKPWRSNSTAFYTQPYMPIAGFVFGDVPSGSIPNIYLYNDSFYIYDSSDRIYSCSISGNGSSNIMATGFVADGSLSSVVTNSDSVSFLWMRSADSSTTGISDLSAAFRFGIGGSLEYSGSVNYIEIISDDLSVVISNQEQIINIMDSMQVDLSSIESSVVDTNQQLQDESSSIWSAFGNKVSSTLESLFVPSQQDIEEVKTGFDELAKDKLGGAYTAMETVEDTVSDISMKLNNPSASEGIEFPGISVPLGGDVGTVTLADAQTVTLPNRNDRDSPSCSRYDYFACVWPWYL